MVLSEREKRAHQRLRKALMKEADRRQDAGHPVSAHELRGMARTLDRAMLYLAGSYEVET